MARIVARYGDRRIEMVREGNRGRWHYTIQTVSPASRGAALRSAGDFETSDVAFQQAVRHLNRLGQDVTEGGAGLRRSPGGA